MKLIKIDPRKIKIPEVRVKAVFDDETYAQFQHAFRELGQLTPIIACDIGGDITLVDGEHRLEESMRNGLLVIDVAVIEGDMVDVLCRNILLDHTRGKHRPSDMIRVVGTLYKTYALDSEKMAERTGLTRDYIEKLLRIATACPELQEVVDLDVIGVSKAYEISRLPSFVQQQEFVAKTTLYKLSLKDLHNFIDQVLREMELLKTQPPPGDGQHERVPVVYHCEACKLEVEAKYLRPVIVCPDCFGKVWRLAKETSPVEAGTPLEGGGG